MANFARDVRDSEFESNVLGSDKPVLVDFWAEWCGPCRMIAPSVEAVAEQYGEKAGFYKMNVDENPNTPSQYGVRGIPTLILVKGGKVVDQLVGSVPKPTVDQFVQKSL